MYVKLIQYRYLAYDASFGQLLLLGLFRFVRWLNQFARLSLAFEVTLYKERRSTLSCQSG